MEFTALYKFVMDTIVKRAASDEKATNKVNHLYPELTP